MEVITKELIKIIESVCTNVTVEYDSLSERVFLYHLVNDENYILDVNEMLQYGGRSLMLVVYYFDTFGLKRTQDYLREIKSKNSPLYRVLNGDYNN